MSRASSHKWAYQSRFRRHAFGWRSRLPVQRVREAVAEIRRVARKDSVLAGEGAVGFLERVAPAIEHVDSSSGSIGNAVSRAVSELAGIIAAASADDELRDVWLERLWLALEDDCMPYIEDLSEHWGALCGTPEHAGAWADRLMPRAYAWLHGGGDGRLDINAPRACLSALFAAGRHDELLELLADEEFWSCRRWGVLAVAAQGRADDALDMAEASRSAWTDDGDIDAICEQILRAVGRDDEAYRRYGLRVHSRGTYLAWFGAVRKAYPDRSAEELLADLVAASPGSEGKWFAAARKAGQLDLALELARKSPCDPRTLTRAARDHASSDPGFALGAGLAALHWLAEGLGYDVTSADVYAACDHTLQAAERCGTLEDVRRRMRAIVAAEAGPDVIVRRVVLACLDGSTGSGR